MPAQAFEAIPLLQQRFPIERAMMRVAITVPLVHRADLADVLQQSAPAAGRASATAGPEAGGAVVEEDDIVGDAYTATALIQPGTFRNLYNFVSQRTGGAGRLDVVAVAAQDVAAGARKDAGPAGGAVGAPTASGAASAIASLSMGGTVAPLAPAAAGVVAGGYSAAVGSGMVVPAATRPRPGPTGEVRTSCPVFFPAGEPILLLLLCNPSSRASRLAMPCCAIPQFVLCCACWAD